MYVKQTVERDREEKIFHKQLKPSGRDFLTKRDKKTLHVQSKEEKRNIFKSCIWCVGDTPGHNRMGMDVN